MIAKYLFHALTVPMAAALVAGAVILVRRRPPRRATVYAATALAGLGGDWLFSVALSLGAGSLYDSLPPDRLTNVILAIGAARAGWQAACVLLLVCAVVADRRPPKPSGPEGDYGEPAAR
jgi:hypothetical protein